MTTKLKDDTQLLDLERKVSESMVKGREINSRFRKKMKALKGDVKIEASAEVIAAFK